MAFFINISKTLLLSTILTLILLGNQSPAQETSLNPASEESKDPHTLIIEQCIALMEKSQWQQTLDLLNPLIEQNQDTGLKKHGAKFATTYYYKGLCLLKLAQNKQKEKNQSAKIEASKLFQDAILSLNQCHAINPPNDNSNTYRAKSLLLRGNAQQSLGKYQLAIDSYKQFLLERNNALDPYNLSDFNINLAICLWKKNTPEKPSPDDTKKAIDLLQESLLYTGRNQPTPLAVLTALNTLTDISIADKNDNLIPSTILRTSNISPQNLIIPTDANTSSKLLSALSNLILQTSQENLPLASLHLTCLIPGISQYEKELEIPSELELPTAEKVEPSEIIKKSLTETTAIALQARALSYQKSNQHNSAIRLYNILVDQYPNTKHQPENLYNLARLSAKTADTGTAITRARQFLKDHPKHSLKNPTLTILLNTLYQSQQYQQSLTLAEKILSQPTPEPTPLPDDPYLMALIDSASFIQAASHYYLGDFTTAAPLLAAHQKTYPDSPYQTDAAYLNAAIQNQLLNLDKSIPLLRDFIASQSQIQGDTDNPQEASTYIPFAHYDIAYAHYSQRHLHTAILSLLPFTLDIPFVSEPITNSQISPSAAILLGNTHLLLRQQNAAVAHYQNAIQLAKETKNIPARDEAYYLLIDLLGKPLWDGLTNHRLKETIPYYLHFLTLENAKQSPYHTQILTSAITALEKATPGQPVHLLLQENLFQHNNSPNTPGVETALKTYLYYLRKSDISTEEIIRILTEEVKTTNSAYHQALILIAKIEALEIAQKRDPETNLSDQIGQLYNDLISQYRTEDLDNFTLLKIADYLTSNSKHTESKDYYQAILGSSSNIKKTEARLSLAIQIAYSEDTAQKQTARTQLTEIINNPFTPPALRATAHYHILKLLLEEENWAEIETNALAYLKYPLDVKTHNLEILQLLALSYDKQGAEKLDAAISTYAHIYVKTLFSLQHSAPAIHRTCQLLWERNNPAQPDIQQGKSDRQLAYETAYKYIRQTKGHFAQRKDSLPDSAIQTWETIKSNAIKTYPKDPNVRPFSGKP